MEDKDQILAELQRVLQEQYPVVREAIHHLEVFLHARSRRAVFELRDALSHIAHIHDVETDAAEARKHLDEIYTHFRRASVEPIEYLAERTWMKCDRVLQGGFWWWPLIGMRKPSLEEREAYYDKRDEIGLLIVKGRNLKATPKAYPVLLEVFRCGQRLLNALAPNELASRLYAAGLTVTCGILLLGWVELKQATPWLRDWAGEHPLLYSLLFLPITAGLVLGGILLFKLGRRLWRGFRKRRLVRSFVHWLYIKVCVDPAHPQDHPGEFDDTSWDWQSKK